MVLEESNAQKGTPYHIKKKTKHQKTLFQKRNLDDPSRKILVFLWIPDSQQTFIFKWGDFLWKYQYMPKYLQKNRHKKIFPLHPSYKALRNYSINNRYDIYDEFIDEAESATTANRPEFQRMIALAKRKPRPFDIILVWKYNRFSRVREVSIVYKKLLKNRGYCFRICLRRYYWIDWWILLFQSILGHHKGFKRKRRPRI